MSKTVTVSYKPDGTVEIKATGFKGAACEKATAEVEKMLGVIDAKRTKTPDYYATEKVGERQRIG